MFLHVEKQMQFVEFILVDYFLQGHFARAFYI